MKKLLIAFLFAVTAVYSFAQNPDSLNGYLIYPKAESLPFKQLDRYRLFLNGESHYMPGNERVAWDLLMGLYKNENVRVVASEWSVSTGFLLNYYMEQGNETEFDNILDRENMSMENVWFFKQLYHFNDGKNEKNFVRIRGVDSGSDAEMAADALDAILGKHNVNNELKDYITLIRNEEIESPQRMLKIYSSDADKYNALLHSDATIFTDIIQELICKSCATYGATDSSKWATREEHIYSNMLHVLLEFKDASVFGKFGSSHTMLNPNYVSSGSLTCPSFASRLNTYDTSPVKGRVCTFCNYYPNGEASPREFIPYGNALAFEKSRQPDNFFYYQRKDTVSKQVGIQSGVQFMTDINYTFRKSIKEFRHDTLFDYVKGSGIDYNGIGFGMNYYKDKVVFLGYERSLQQLKGRLQEVCLGIGGSYNLDHPGYGTYIEMRAGYFVVVGVKSSLYYDQKSVSLYTKPEVGVNYSLFTLLYGYDFRTIGAPIDHLDKNVFTLIVTIPFGGSY